MLLCVRAVVAVKQYYACDCRCNMYICVRMKKCWKFTVQTKLFRRQSSCINRMRCLFPHFLLIANIVQTNMVFFRPLLNTRKRNVARVVLCCIFWHDRIDDHWHFCSTLLIFGWLTKKRRRTSKQSKTISKISNMTHRQKCWFTCASFSLLVFRGSCCWRCCCVMLPFSQIV